MSSVVGWLAQIGKQVSFASLNVDRVAHTRAKCRDIEKAARTYVRRQAERLETMYYGYALNPQQNLLGVVSFRYLFSSDRAKPSARKTRGMLGKSRSARGAILSTEMVLKFGVSKGGSPKTMVSIQPLRYGTPSKLLIALDWRGDIRRVRIRPYRSFIEQRKQRRIVHEWGRGGGPY